MRVSISILLCLIFFDCSSRGRTRTGSSPSSARLKIERPGMGAALDEKIANLVLSNKMIKAKKLCNDVLFASRSNQDRETANYWRTLLIAQEEIESGNYTKSMELLKNGAKWWKSRAKDYHVALVKQLLEELRSKEKVNEELRKTNKNLVAKIRVEGDDSKAQKLSLENQQMKEAIIKLKAENAKLTQLLIDLESR